MARVDKFAPLDRRWVDTLSPIIRAIVGGAFVAFSSYATIFLFAADIEPILHDRASLGLFADRYWFGWLLAFMFFVGEIMSAERWPKAYLAILVPDTIYTSRQMYPGFHEVFRVLMTDMITVMIILVFVGVGVFLIAYAAEWSKARWMAGWLLLSVTNIGLILLDQLQYAIIATSGELSIFCGYIVARFGEALLFGARRKSTSTARATA